MPKRKDHALHQTTDVSVQPNTNATSKDANTDLESLPIPIQNFLWRQFSPFVRPYNRKLQEASCVTFERILVQNNLHGLSPSLSDAILSIPRWRFIVAALPYVMHCCASTLESQPRRSLMHSAGDADREDPSSSGQPSSAPPAAPLGPNTTKLLYTLHYLLLDAVADCVDSARQERPVPTGRRSSLYPHHTGAPSTEPYLFPITSLQVLVYLFAPLLPQLDPSDFRSSERAGRTNRLENGLRLWQPLWEYRQPDIPLFTAPAKPTRHTNDTMSEMETVPSGLGNVGDIYTGAEVDEGFLLAEPERNVEEAAAAKEALHRAKTAPHSGAPLAHMSEICTLTTLETPVTLTPTLEYICEFCNTKIQPAEKELLRYMKLFYSSAEIKPRK